MVLILYVKITPLSHISIMPLEETPPCCCTYYRYIYRHRMTLHLVPNNGDKCRTHHPRASSLTSPGCRHELEGIPEECRMRGKTKSLENIIMYVPIPVQDL